MNKRRGNLTELKFSLLDSRGLQAAHWRIVVVHGGIGQEGEIIRQRLLEFDVELLSGKHIALPSDSRMLPLLRPTGYPVYSRVPPADSTSNDVIRPTA